MSSSITWNVLAAPVRTGKEIANMLDAGITFDTTAPPMEAFLDAKDRLTGHRAITAPLCDVATLHLYGGHCHHVAMAPNAHVRDLPAVAATALEDHTSRTRFTSPCPQHQGCRLLSVAVPATTGLDDELNAIQDATASRTPMEVPA